MPEIVLNYFASTEEPLRYTLPNNGNAYSTISISQGPKETMKMGFDLPVEKTQPAFGTHIHEAVEIVKDWMHKR